MKVEGHWRRTIELGADAASVNILDQARLPHQIAWMRLDELEHFVRAIRDMHIRGAPLIGATAAHGIAIAMRQDASDAGFQRAYAALAATRPTAINLRWALDVMKAALHPLPASARADAAMAHAAKICDDDVATCRAIGDHGRALIRAAAEQNPDRPVRVLTHCNAGWLATVDWGTALAPIYTAFEAGLPVEVWVDETRPRNQGLLTAWELHQHGVPHTLIADNSGGHLMQQGLVDLCLVGTDRTTRQGDVCNKIGTYLKALAAHDCGVPFYAAVPSSSIDWTVGEPAEIPIEERSGEEVRVLSGRGGRFEIVGPETRVANPAFDVTPRRLVTGLITERGITEPRALRDQFPEHAR
jgi:methylthioribose-1-phosphate isomerase